MTNNESEFAVGVLLEEKLYVCSTHEIFFPTCAQHVWGLGEKKINLGILKKDVIQVF